MELIEEINKLRDSVYQYHHCTSCHISRVKELANTRLLQIDIVRNGQPDRFYYITNKFARVLEVCQTYKIAVPDQLEHEADFIANEVQPF